MRRSGGEAVQSARDVVRKAVIAVCLILTPCVTTPVRSQGVVATRTAAHSDASEAGSETATPQYQHAEALYLSGRLQEAAAAFEQLARATPRNARVWLKYGNTLTKLGRYDAASDAFQMAMSLDSTEGGAAINLALVRLAQAQTVLEAAQRGSPPDSPIHARAQALQRHIATLVADSDIQTTQARSGTEIQGDGAHVQVKSTAQRTDP